MKHLFFILFLFLCNYIFAQKMPSQTLNITSGFLVTIKKDAGMIDAVTIRAKQNKHGKLQLPFKTYWIQENKGTKIQYIEGGTLEFVIKKGGYFILRNGYE